MRCGSTHLGAGRERGTHATRSRSTGTPITRAFAPEKVALTGEQIGNFPQVFSHLSLMDAAKSLN
jgi:hypothetical protein